MNSINLVGRIVRDCELKYLSEGKCVLNFTLAVDRRYKDKDGNKITDFIPIVAFNKEKLSNYLLKGKLVSISGSMNIDKYKDKDGNNRTFAKVSADNITLLNSKSENTQSSVFDKSNAKDVSYVQVDLDEGSYAPPGFSAMDDEDLPF